MGDSKSPSTSNTYGVQGGPGDQETCPRDIGPLGMNDSAATHVLGEREQSCELVWISLSHRANEKGPPPTYSLGIQRCLSEPLEPDSTQFCKPQESFKFKAQGPALGTPRKDQQHPTLSSATSSTTLPCLFLYLCSGTSSNSSQESLLHLSLSLQAYTLKTTPDFVPSRLHEQGPWPILLSPPHGSSCPPKPADTSPPPRATLSKADKPEHLSMKNYLPV